jgi:RNA polymerase sigma factor (sigma-70 family)
VNDATELLQAAAQGDPQAAEKLLPLVYDELRKLAAAHLAHEKPGQTLQATALVHEAYLRLVGPAGPAGLAAGTDAEKLEVGSQTSEAPTSDLRSPTSDQSRPADGTYHSRAHFSRAAAEAMRRVLVDSARRKRSAKRGGGQQRVELIDPPARLAPPDEDVVAIAEALDKLERSDPVKAELVKLRYFVGLTLEEAAQVLGISRATANRYWAYAKVWLFRELQAAGDDSEH